MLFRSLLIPNTSTAHTARSPATASHFFVLSFMAFPPYAFLIDFRSSHATIERLESLWKCNKSYDICNMLLKFLPVGRPHLQPDRHIRQDFSCETHRHFHRDLCIRIISSSRRCQCRVVDVHRKIFEPVLQFTTVVIEIGRASCRERV